MKQQKSGTFLNREFLSDFHPKVRSKNNKEQYKFKKNQFDCFIPRVDSLPKLFSLFDQLSSLLEEKAI